MTIIALEKPRGRLEHPPFRSMKQQRTTIMLSRRNLLPHSIPDTFTSLRMPLRLECYLTDSSELFRNVSSRIANKVPY